MNNHNMRTLIDILVDVDLRQLDDKLMNKLAVDNGVRKPSSVYGLYDYDHHKIFLRKSLNHEDKIRTLLHEVVHAYSRLVQECEGVDGYDELTTERLARDLHNDIYGFKKYKK